MREIELLNHCNYIRSYDDKGNKHGYFETWFDGSMWVRVNYVHDSETGYEEFHGECETTFYIR